MSIFAQSEEGSVVATVIWGLIGLAWVVGIIWAIVSRIRRERKEDKFENRDN